MPDAVPMTSPARSSSSKPMHPSISMDYSTSFGYTSVGPNGSNAGGNARGSRACNRCSSLSDGL
jgi:hypothetical protein